MEKQELLSTLRLSTALAEPVADRDELQAIMVNVCLEGIEPENLPINVDLEIRARIGSGKLPWFCAQALAVAAQYLLDLKPGEDVRGVINDEIFPIAEKYLRQAFSEPVAVRQGVAA